MTAARLRDRFHHDLFERYLPFFLKYMVDRETGGFFPYTELDGRPRPPEGRTAWWLGRGVWTVSFLYSHLDKKREYLDIGLRAADILIKNRPSGDNLWPASFDRAGAPIAPPSTHIYDDMFVAEGLAQLAQASGESGYRALAKETVLKCLRLYDRPDYSYAVTYGPKADPFPGPRVIGHWMVFINTISQMLRYESDAELEAVLFRCTEAVLKGHLHPEYRLMTEVRAHDLSLPEGPLSQFSYSGHAYETLWMIMSEAARRKDAVMFNEAADLFVRHVRVSRDDVYGGELAGLQDVDGNVWQTSKSAWAQVEALVGCLLLLEHRGDPWAKEMYGEMYTYFQDRYSLEKQGCPIWHLGGDRNLKTIRPGTGDIYHIPRWLMLNLLSLDGIIGRRGKTSGLV